MGFQAVLVNETDSSAVQLKDVEVAVQKVTSTGRQRHDALPHPEYWLQVEYWLPDAATVSPIRTHQLCSIACLIFVHMVPTMEGPGFAFTVVKQKKGNSVRVCC
jgi:hypothetical protein